MVMRYRIPMHLQWLCFLYEYHYHTIMLPENSLKRYTRRKDAVSMIKFHIPIYQFLFKNDRRRVSTNLIASDRMHTLSNYPTCPIFILMGKIRFQ